MLRNQDRALSNIESIPGGFQQLSSLFGKADDSMVQPDPSTEEANRQMAERLGVSGTSPRGINSQALPNPWSTSAPASAIVYQDGFSGSSVPNRPGRAITINQTISETPASLPTGGVSDSMGTMMEQMRMMQNMMARSQQPNANLGGSTLPNMFAPGSPFSSLLRQSGTPSGISSLFSQGMPMPLSNGIPFANNPAIPVPIPTEPVDIRYSEQLATLQEMGFTDSEKNKRAILAAVT